MSGGSIEKLKERLGHNSVNVTERYAHLGSDPFTARDLATNDVDLSAGAPDPTPFRTEIGHRMGTDGRSRVRNNFKSHRKCRSRPVSRVLFRELPRGDEHSSRTRVAARLERAEPGGVERAALRPASRRSSLPICPCTRWGLPCRPRHRERGALLPHPFTLATHASRRRSAVCSLWHFPAGRPDRSLTGTLPSGARTFLGRHEF